MTTTTQLTINSLIGWAASENSCIKCNRKVGKNSWFVHLSNAGVILPADYEGRDSQGFWEVGSECAKSFDPKVLVKKSW